MAAGRMRALLAALFLSLFAAGAAHAALTFPPLTGRVVDDAGILSADTKARLTALLAEHEQQTGNQVVVAILKSLQGDDIRDYGYQLGRAWGIGQKGKNNGVVLVVAPHERKVSIEVGYGLEGTLTDAQSALIIQNAILPEFRKGDYDAGVLDGTVDILRTLGGKPSNVESVPQPQAAPQASHGGGIPIVFIILFLLFFGGRFFWPLLFLGGMGGWGGRGPWGGGGFGGSGFGGGGFGGGGFSGGGGSFGGGGASGGW